LLKALRFRTLPVAVSTELVTIHQGVEALVFGEHVWLPLPPLDEHQSGAAA